MINYIYPFIASIISGLLVWIIGENYNISNYICFGTFLLLLGIRIDWSIFIRHWKGISSFFLFSTVTTTLLELMFMKSDTWGFSRTFNTMIGINLLGYPIEEYVFWELCPVVVIFTYLYYVGLIKPVFKLFTTSASMYIDDKVNVNDGYPSYNRGSKVPVYTGFIGFVIMFIWLMRDYFKNRVKEIVLTGIVFLSLIAPYEQYALLNQVWVYNLNKMTGIVLVGVPIEEWLIYIACPIAGALFIRIFTKKIDKDAL